MDIRKEKAAEDGGDSGEGMAQHQDVPLPLLSTLAAAAGDSDTDADGAPVWLSQLH